MRLAIFVAVVALAAVASATPRPPSGPHPRMLLDAKVREAWKQLATARRGPVHGAIALCTSGQGPDHDRALYQGSEWSRLLQACLVAWAATERPEHAETAIKFFTALLDDRDRIGDRQGGETSARRDSGYALRNLGPYTALAYDWLHDVPGMTPALRARARARWAAWLSWYRQHGYRARVPGTNYQAGFLAAATMIAIAQSEEAAAEGGPELWAFVADELWAKDMAGALAPGGILDGGDWPEGWQYGPLAVAHYALAARVARAAGLTVAGVDTWLAAVLRRHVHGLSPADRVYVGQDTQITEPNVPPHVLTLAAIALGDATPQDQRWAKGELARLDLHDKDYFLYAALATIGERPALPPRASWPTWYAAAATGTVFARTRWDERAVWLVAECQHGLDVDHRHPKAGNFVLSRGRDDLIVDPSPYGSRSTLTSNAPTVTSAHFPARYIPSQAAWGDDVGWDWAMQTRSGVVALRCDYAGAYKFQHRDSDVRAASRDLVLLPSRDGTDAALVVIDRARTGAAQLAMHLRFRVAGGLGLDRDVATKTLGGSRLVIAAIERSAGRPQIGRTSIKDCFGKGTILGQCDAARFDASDYRLEIAGPEPRAVHVIDALPAGTRAATAGAALEGPTWRGVQVTGPRAAVVVWPKAPTAALRYRGSPGTHVVLDAPQVAGLATITAHRDGDACAVEVSAGGPSAARPAVFELDAACAVTLDPATGRAASAARSPARSATPGPRGSGCCAAHGAPGSSIALGLGALGLARRRRRRAAG